MMLRRYKHAFILGGLALLAVAGLLIDHAAYSRGVSYHGANRIVLNDGTLIRSEERVIIGDVLSFAAMERVGSEVNYASLLADVVHVGPRSLELELQKAQTSRAKPMQQLSEIPDVFFGRQYGLATGATLRLEFLPVSDDRVICYYAREIDNVRCLNR
ncbi:hypothetical protein FXN65_08030 [Metapseudomonas lalkuanensis]|uniref:Uncharacterized protein n=1 Tax=Metapseudomonas lalkuanensis TaxID=2604832 RepID=A0A5J6QH03_9GAMM|nr:hypothetical protein [Pseudomonas lalkuanensis]QEY62018.1 hypothetical protein FXN65_08030 [Pseudomonas lalkuanensis]